MNASMSQLQGLTPATSTPMPPQQMLRGWMQMLRAQAAQAPDSADLLLRLRACDDPPQRRAG